MQLGERLGLLPTEGYYYHFHNDRLVQEFGLLGEGKWAFYATCSTHERLTDEQGYNVYQSAILVYWKLEGKEIDNQHLIYLEKQITREELDNLNDDWLVEHGIKHDINELLATPKQPVVERQTTQPVETDKAATKPETHMVGADSTGIMGNHCWAIWFVGETVTWFESAVWCWPDEIEGWWPISSK